MPLLPWSKDNFIDLLVAGVRTILESQYPISNIITIVCGVGVQRQFCFGDVNVDCLRLFVCVEKIIAPFCYSSFTVKYFITFYMELTGGKHSEFGYVRISHNTCIKN